MENYDDYDDNEEVEVICFDCKDYFTLPANNSQLELGEINCVADHRITED